MPETAESHSSTFTTNRNCTIAITSMSHNYHLTNPKVYMESGFPYSPPQPTICCDKPEVCSFDKDDNTFSGTVGVMTYELFCVKTKKREKLLTIMFSVPFDYNLYENWFAVGLFEPSQPCDEALYKHMYNDEADEFSRQKANGSCLEHMSKPVVIRACMSNEGQAIMKVEVYEE